MQIINTKSYPIYLGLGIATQAFELSCKKQVLVCDDHIKTLYAHQFFQLVDLNLSIVPGEGSKTREVKHELEDSMLAQACDRQTMLYALGGGVVTDLTGYLASSYYRGIDWTVIPTSLLAMVDSSIGGKTAVNTPWGKNLIGHFYFPNSVWIDVAFLNTLPFDEFCNGMAEVIKHAVLFDLSYWQFLMNEREAIVALEPSVLMAMIKRSIELKYAVVARDPFEKNDRALLNFGHTIAHGIEMASRYQIKHGEAVAYGMVLEAFILKRPIDKLIDGLKQFGLLMHGDLGNLDGDKCIQAILHDKKNCNGDIYMVNWQDIGLAHLPTAVSVNQIEKAFIALKDLV